MQSLNVNLKGDKCRVPARGKNTLRFALHWMGPGTNAAWIVSVYARIEAGGELVSLGITYAYSANGTVSGPHVVPACEELVFVVTTTEKTGSSVQDTTLVRLQAMVTAE